jgi:hypothetical protein
MRSRSAPERFPAAGNRDALVRLTRHHREAGDEVFCTPLTRRSPRSGKAGGVLPGRVVWIDIDDPAALTWLRAFPHRPHLVAYSGSGGVHAYWRLSRPLEPEAIEAVNRKLAAHVGGDLASTDRARIMRVAGSMNWKARRPCRIAYLDLAAPPVAAATLVAGLTDPDPPPPPRDPATVRRRLESEVPAAARQVPPPVYFRLLARVDVPERGGDVRCPLPDHGEQNPSCRVYPHPEQGWVCFGCRRGGSIYDLASLLEGGPGGRRGALHGEEFRRVKQRSGICSDSSTDESKAGARAGGEETR